MNEQDHIHIAKPQPGEQLYQALEEYRTLDRIFLWAGALVLWGSGFFVGLHY